MTRQACACDKCRAACHTVPGWFASMAEVQQAADHFGLDLDTFVRQHCVIDFYDYAPGTPLAISPARMDDIWDDRMEAGGGERETCSFLTEHGCRLPLEKRPHECATYMHGHALPTDETAPRRVLSEAWAKEDQARLRAWADGERLAR